MSWATATHQNVPSKKLPRFLRLSPISPAGSWIMPAAICLVAKSTPIWSGVRPIEIAIAGASSHKAPPPQSTAPWPIGKVTKYSQFCCLKKERMMISPDQSGAYLESTRILRSDYEKDLRHQFTVSQIIDFSRYQRERYYHKNQYGSKNYGTHVHRCKPKGCSWFKNKHPAHTVLTGCTMVSIEFNKDANMTSLKISSRFHWSCCCH